MATPDQEQNNGQRLWEAGLDRQAGIVADVLAAISESAENQAGVMPVIGNGFPYTLHN